MQENFWIPSITNGIRITDFQHIEVPPSWQFRAHRHTVFEFIFILEGSMEEKVNGRRHLLQTNEFLLIKSGMLHESLPSTTLGARMFIFHFDIDDSKITEALYRTTTLKLQDQEIQRLVNSLLNNHGTFLEHQSLSEVPGIETSIRLLDIQSVLLQLIGRLAHLHYMEDEHQPVSHLSPTQLSLAHEAARFIEEKEGVSIKISSIAKELNIDRSYLTGIFKKVYGMAPKSYISKTRVTKAKELLTNTDISVEEIGVKLGYSSVAHFSKDFSNYTGVSPSQFRKLTF